MFEYKAKVKEIIDGDTYDLEVDLGFGVKIDKRLRLLDVDTPEVTGELKDFGKFVEQYVADQFAAAVEITVRTFKDPKKSTDQYGRFLAEVTLKGKNGNSYNLGKHLCAMKYGVPNPAGEIKREELLTAHRKNHQEL